MLKTKILGGCRERNTGLTTHMSHDHTHVDQWTATVAAAHLLTTRGRARTLGHVRTRDDQRTGQRRHHCGHPFDHRPAHGQTVGVTLAAAMRDVARGRLRTAMEAVLAAHGLWEKACSTRCLSHAGPDLHA